MKLLAFIFEQPSYLKQTSSIQNTAHTALACSFWHHLSASNLKWDDSDFKAWVKYFGMPCSGPDTFTSPYTKPWSLVISLIDGFLKVSHSKSTWFARLTRRDRLWESHICLTTKSWRQIYTRLYQEHSIQMIQYKHLYFWEHLWLSSSRAHKKSWFVYQYRQKSNKSI